MHLVHQPKIQNSFAILMNMKFCGRGILKFGYVLIKINLNGKNLFQILKFLYYIFHHIHTPRPVRHVCPWSRDTRPHQAPGPCDVISIVYHCHIACSEGNNSYSTLAQGNGKVDEWGNSWVAYYPKPHCHCHFV